MRVYRVEDSAHEGPYWAHSKLIAVMNSQGIKTDGLDDPAQPVPARDPMLMAFATRNPVAWRMLVFGFASLQDFAKWFHDPLWLDVMQEDGYSLNEYEVPDGAVIQGTGQLVFVPFVAEPIRTLDMHEAVKLSQTVGHSLAQELEAA